MRGGNDFALSTSNGANADEFDGGAGSDTVALLGDISDYQITNNWDGGIRFIDRNGKRVLTATDLEFYRFNYNADGYTERSQDELQDFINDSPGRIDVSFSGLRKKTKFLVLMYPFSTQMGLRLPLCSGQCKKILPTVG